MRRAIPIAAAVAVLALVVAGITWRRWTTSPTYSLKEAADAVGQHDRYGFEKYVDVDAVLQSFAVDVSDGNPLAGAMGAAVIPQIKTQIIKTVEEGGVPNESRVGQGIQRMLGGQLPKPEKEGPNAFFTVNITTKGGAPFALKIHMAQVPDGYWRVDRISNMNELRAVEDQEEVARKAAIAKANEEKLAKLKVVAKLHTSIRDGWDRKNRFQVRLENKADKAIAAFTGHIRAPAQEFDHGVRDSVPIAAHATEVRVWEPEVNRFIADTERVFALGETDQFDVDIDSLTFADGTKVTRGSER